VEKYDRAGQTTDDNLIWRIRFACWMNNAADTHLEYALNAFHGNSGFVNVPQCYVYAYIACLFLLQYILLLKETRYETAVYKCPLREVTMFAKPVTMKECE